MDPQFEPPQKKPRSDAQNAALKAMQAARERKIIEKYEAEQKGKQETPAPPAEEKEEPAPVPEPVTAAMAEPVEAVVPEHVPVAAAAAPAAHDEDICDASTGDEDVEFFDADGLLNLLDETRSELADLKQRVHRYASEQDELSTSWKQHNIRRVNDINFV